MTVREVEISKGAIEYVWVAIRDTEGADLSTATVQLGFQDEPDSTIDWRSIDSTTIVQNSNIRVAVLIGSSYTPPTGTYRVWVKINNGVETVVGRVEKDLVRIS